MATTTRERFRAMDVIEMPVSDQNVSSRENLWSGGYFGLPSAQGSRTITSPEGNLNSKVAVTEPDDLHTASFYAGLYTLAILRDLRNAHR